MQIVIVGAGGFGRETLDVVEAMNEQLALIDQHIEVLGFLDDGAPDPEPLKVYGLDVIGMVGDLLTMPPDVGYVIGIGSPAAKRAIDEQLPGRRSPVLVHPSASLARDVELGPGSIVCAGVRITNRIRLGRHVHLNLNTTVGHDTGLGDYLTASPLCGISGNVHAEPGVFLGTGAMVNPGLRLGVGSVVGSGAAVIRNVEAGTTVVGVPAKARG